MKYTRKMNKRLLYTGIMLILVACFLYSNINTRENTRISFNTSFTPNRYDTIYVYDGTYLDITNRIRTKFNRLPITKDEEAAK